MPKTIIIDVAVRQSNGTYTAAHKGVRASCTAGAQQTAERLAEKLFGASFVRVEQNEPMPGDDHTIERWELWGEQVIAWCWQSGRIDIGKQLPEGAISFATGLETDLRRVLDVLARHGQGASAGLLLVPGVPEARDNGNAKVDALIAWTRDCASRDFAGVGLGTVKFKAKQAAAA